MNRALPLLLSCSCLVPACRRPAAADDAHDEPPPATNRIDVPEAVRRNLGIEFVTVERRRVATTMRLPGHFELLPQARYEHRTPMAGRVEVRVVPLQPVAAGDVLYTIDSPDWRRLQRELGELETALTVTKAHIESMRPLLLAHEAHEQSLAEALVVMAERVQSLTETQRSVGGQAQALAEARVQLAQVRSQRAEAAESHSSTEARLAELEANERAHAERSRLLLESAAAMLGMQVEQLASSPPGVSPPAPRWRTLGVIEVHAVAAGLVDHLPVASGAWVEAHELVLTVTDLGKVRFRARGLQSDLGRLRDGLPATIVAPSGADAGDPSMQLTGPLQLGLQADPQQRTIDLFVTPTSAAPFARPGIAAFLEVATATGAAPELAVPLSAIMQDGLARVFFRRDPDDPDKVMRVDADLGLDDGRWVEVKSGLVDGDQVVLAGAYELMLATSGTASKGGHFHADGTFHEDHK
ncbi:MAG TPA: efflux RND transporter periplasmic adaptor subunit [Planctomycetota bacterium]|nr:efflux RND transporter periplasmic adaptor subunit [Planctomycetota bacterium]